MNKNIKGALVGAVALALPSIAFAQGTDDCVAPTPISGTGAFVFDTTASTPSTFDLNAGGVVCETTMNEDAFFVWTAAAAGTHVFGICDATFDTQMQMGVGVDCAAICAFNNDDACGLRSAIEVPGILIGDQYVIQVGAFTALDVGMGTLTVDLLGAPPANDTCATPDPISGLGSFPYTRTGASNSGFDGLDPATCGQAFSGAPARDVFFAWTATASGAFIFDNCGAANDVEINAHLGGDCTAVCVSGSNPAICAINGEAQITLTGVTAGDVYLIQVGDFGDTEIFAANGSLNVSVPPPPPTNDTCATPDVISGVGSFPYDRTQAIGSGFDGGDPVTCASALGNATPDRDVFFAWTALAGGIFIFDNCGELADTDMNIHTGGDCTATCLGNNDTGSCATADESEIVLSGVVAGDVYLVQIGNWAAGSVLGGPGALNVTVPAVARPGNDNCSTPTAIGGTGAFAFDTTTALTSGFVGGDPLACGSGQNGSAPYRDVFFAWTAAVSGNIAFDTCGSTFDTLLNVHLGGDCAAVCLDSNDNGACAVNGESSVSVFGVTAGDIYLIQIGEWAAAPTPGPGMLNVSVPPPPPANDTCATPTAISGLGNFAYDTTSSSTSGFTGSAGGCVGGVVNGDVFLLWTAAAAGDYRFDTCGSTYDTRIALYSGVDCLATCIADNDDFCGLQSQAEALGLAAGDTVLVQLGAFGAGVEGPAVLNVTNPPPPPANNDCSTPTPITGFGSFFFDNSSASTSGFNGGEIASNGIHPCFPHDTQTGLEQEIANDLFFVWTAPCAGDFQIDTEGNTVITDTKVNIHAGSDCSAVCYQGDDDDGTNLLSLVTITGATAGGDYLIQVGGFNAGTATGAGQINITDLGSCPTSSITVTCDPASQHFLGNYAKMGNSSFGSGIGSGLHVEVTDGPAGEFGFILVSADSNSSLAIFNGVLCLGSPQGRYNPLVATNQGDPTLNSIGQFDAAGVLQSLFGNAASTGGSGFDVPANLPFSPAGQMIMPGDMWSFQCWYRDQIAVPGDTANFSNAIDAVFP